MSKASISTGGSISQSAVVAGQAIDGIRHRKSGSHRTCMGLFLSRGFSPRGWAVDPLIVRLGLLTVLCSERERPFFVPSPAIRFPERAEGVKGDRNASAAWQLGSLCFAAP